jgi:hypothetical protein
MRWCQVLTRACPGDMESKRLVISLFRHPEVLARRKRVYARLDALWGEPRRATAPIVPLASVLRDPGRASFEGRARARPPQDDGT